MSKLYLSDLPIGYVKLFCRKCEYLRKSL